jgi:hypothetical protein
LGSFSELTFINNVYIYDVLIEIREVINEMVEVDKYIDDKNNQRSSSDGR